MCSRRKADCRFRFRRIYMWVGVCWGKRERDRKKKARKQEELNKEEDGGQGYLPKLLCMYTR